MLPRLTDGPVWNLRLRAADRRGISLHGHRLSSLYRALTLMRGG